MMGGEYTTVVPRIRESKHTLANVSKIQKIFGWEPKKSLKEYMENKEYDNRNK
jgi:nucleoside-diphosphate-sugar epimerase